MGEGATTPDSIQTRVVSELGISVLVFGFGLWFSNTTFRQCASCLTQRYSVMMQVQSQRVTTHSAPAISRVAGVQLHPRRLHAFSGASSHSFATGIAICARPVRKVTSRCQNQRVHADIFFTQKTVPDQTGRVAIVTGKLRERYAVLDRLRLTLVDICLAVPGSSSGMGFEVAKCLSQKNATVIIAARNKQKCEK